MVTVVMIVIILMIMLTADGGDDFSDDGVMAKPKMKAKLLMIF